MDEKVEISLITYEKMREKEREFDNLSKEMLDLKESCKKEINLTLSHILKFTINLQHRLHSINIASEHILNEAATESGFSIKYTRNHGEINLGDGKEKTYNLNEKDFK